MELTIVLKLLAFAVLCVAAAIDIKTNKIPNYLPVVLFILGVVRMFIQKEYASYLIGLVFPSIILLLLRIHDSRNIGFGDIKIVMATGSFYGYISAGIIVLASLMMLCIFVLMQRKKGKDTKTVCYGPFLAISGLAGFFL